MTNHFIAFEKYLADCAEGVNAVLEEYLDLNEDEQLRGFCDAMRYSVFSGGKRARPFLLIAVADVLGISRKQSLKYSAIIELIHAYSLVHDDLPAIDNDDYRRGKESCHKKFGEGVAILVGDALLNRAFEVLAMDDDEVAPTIRIKVMQTILNATSVKGLIGGQALDLQTRGDNVAHKEGVDRINSMKTGALFNLCFEIPVLLADSQMANKLKPRLGMYIKSTSAAFQIADDIEDFEEDKKKGYEFTNIACITGIAKAKHEVKILTDQAISMIDGIDPTKTKVLIEFAKYICAKI